MIRADTAGSWNHHTNGTDAHNNPAGSKCYVCRVVHIEDEKSDVRCYSVGYHNKDAVENCDAVISPPGKTRKAKRQLFKNGSNFF